MLHRLAILAVTIGLAAAAGAQPADASRPKATGRLLGKFKGLTYHAPKELFRLPTPVDGDLGGRVQDRPGFVSFMDDLDGLYRIEHIAFDARLAPLRAELGERKFLERMISGTYLPQTILVAFPQARFAGHAFHEQPQPMLVTAFLLPKGSLTENHKGNGTVERYDAYRSVAAFVRNGRIFFVSVMTSGATLTPERPARPETEIWNELEKATVEFIRTIEFPSK